ncbi:MmcQ/YjbR family DNA-binding protein [Terasakiella sp. A23]|uniref:MmcQ/YjbR family DNA-binding protein n=1 Tax=Terasakiella sp. FCG-A23 TaxID=3080561 RepID=UPI002954C908|nr:MmcQ/YjbR family DNA-binding protein [Terasakiella sp. A23]MDV7341417.1 MmcQ/YjbR family DNA-binding protein [Terasakiella sp. A23]
MTRDEFDQFCASLKATTHVIQWGGASVWKIGGKIFAIAPLYEDDDYQRISFKCSDLSYDILIEQEGIVPAPYLARAKWVQVQDPVGMKDDDLKDYIEAAYDIISKKLTKTLQRELGLIA